MLTADTHAIPYTVQHLSRTSSPKPVGVLLQHSALTAEASPISYTESFLLR